MATAAEKLRNISDTQGQLPFKRLELPPFPEQLVKIVPQMEDYQRKAQAVVDEWVKSLNVVKAS